MSSDRFLRNYELTIGVTGLISTVIKPPIRIAFSCDKSVIGGLNKLNIKIYNLKEDTRLNLVKDLESSTYKPIQLKIGYRDKKELIFKGDVRRGINQKEGVNFISYLECLDGGHGFENSVISKSVKTGNILTSTLVSTLQNISIGLINKDFTIIRPKILIGNPIEILKDTLNNDEELFIENEQIFIIKNKQTIGTYLPLVSANSGLLNVPERQQQITTFDTVINPSLRLGGKCILESKTAPHVNGIYKIQSMSYVGDTHGSDWNQKVQGILQGDYKGL